MGFWYYHFTTFIFIFFLFIYFLFYFHFCPIFPHFFPFLPFFFPFVLHLNVIIFSFIPTGLLKILREERQDHPNYRQNSSPFSLCCCIIIKFLRRTILESISLCPPIRIIYRAILPQASRGSAIHTFLVSFQYTFHLLKKVRYIIIIIITVIVCHLQHFFNDIVIIIPLNKVINHHKQCNGCQSFVQPSTHDATSPESSYIFQEK